MKESLTDAYSDVRHQLQTSHQRQKEIYDRKVHGEPYKAGDLVWLYHPAVPQGHSRKLHHPWTGPFKVLGKLSDADYRIKEVYGKKAPSVVHFDRLKLCHPSTRFSRPIDDDEGDVTLSEEPPTNIFEMEMVHTEDDAGVSVRRSARHRQPPTRYEPIVEH